MTSSHRTALDRQATESIRIEARMGKSEELLNTKSEWAGSKLPGLAVKAPIGVGKVGERTGGEGKTEGEIQEEELAIKRWEEAINKGIKRIPYMDSRGDTGGIYNDMGGKERERKEGR